MKNFTIAFLVFIIWSFFGLWFYHWLQPDTIAMNKIDRSDVTEETISPEYKNEKVPLLDENDTTTVNTPTTAESSFGLKAVTDNGDLLFSYPENIEITKNSASINIPTNTQDFKYKLNSYLLEHPDTELVIASKYSAEENIESPNYGTQRAQQIKTILVDTGIPGQRIVLKPHITSIEFNNNNSFNNAFSFTIQPLNKLRIANIKKEVPETKTIYPRYSDSGILNSPELEKMLQEVKTALEANPKMHITIVGHTDNVGNAIDNYRRGLELAKQVRWYLVAKGNINKNKIVATSEGERQAIASNNTEKGRVLNQRIELKFTVE